MRSAAQSVINHIPNLPGSKFKGPLRLAKKMLRSAALPFRERFVGNCVYLDVAEKSSLYSRDMRLATADYEAGCQHVAAFDRVSHADFLNQMLYLDTKIFMTSLNLNYNDKMSMACSVEVRVPFLDHEFAEFVAWNVPPNLKLNGFFSSTTKNIFRKAMNGILPGEVLGQPKAGFAAPTDYWLANGLREMTDDLLSESSIKSRGLFRPESIQKLVREHRSGTHDWSTQIWQFLTLELWTQRFVDGAAGISPPESVSAAIA